MRAVTPRLELRALVLPGHAPLDLTVAEGELVAVAGWGSSALLWAVAGSGAATGGDILVDGSRVVDHDQALAARVALITPGSALASLLTAYENVLLPLTEDTGSGAPPGKRAREEPGPVATARSALVAVGLAESADHLIEDLSGGQQQRVAIARALAGRPRLLLADQPTSDLDAANRNRVVELLREAVTGGAAVLLSSDDPAVLAAADRTVTLARSAG